MSAIEAIAAITSTLSLIDKKLDDIKPKEIQKVVVIPKSENFSFIEVGRASTTSQTRPNAPNIEFQNPRDRPSSITEISIVPDVNFRTKGMIEITANDVILYRTKAAGDFTDIGDDTTVFKGGKTIQANQKIKVYLWNGVDANSVAITAKITFGEVIE